MIDRVKVGLVGVGRMGLNHLRKYLENPDAEVVGVYEPDPTRAGELVLERGVRIFSTLAELFFEADAVSIASPTPTHFPIAKQALDAGVHVLIEKPMTETVRDALELDRIAREKKVVLQVGFIERFRLQALTAEVPPGSVRFIEGSRLAASLGRESSVDVVTDLMIHDLDLALSIIQEEPSFISAIGVPVLTERFDMANVRLEFPSGAVVNLNASRVSAKPFRRLRIFSLAAYASVDFISNVSEVYWRTPDGRVHSQVHPPREIDALAAQLSHFLLCVREGRQPLVGAGDGVLALKYAKIIQEKIEERGAWKPAPNSFPREAIFD